ncbi:Uncharacterised protein [Streptococcus pneumoniae]|nr:Uncharacterised protein [Streptococcus pneumoniae]VRF64831.1 Uncharacterised protein [Streptococcus pneumoniae]
MFFVSKLQLKKTTKKINYKNVLANGIYRFISVFIMLSF